MTQKHLDTRVSREPFYGACSNEMVRGEHGVDSALMAARTARRRRLHLSVCAWCATDDQKAVFAMFDNLSHGICSPCMGREIGGAR